VKAIYERQARSACTRKWDVMSLMLERDLIGNQDEIKVTRREFPFKYTILPLNLMRCLIPKG
jgi:hypothetical protein